MASFIPQSVDSDSGGEPGTSNLHSLSWSISEAEFEPYRLNEALHSLSSCQITFIRFLT